MRTIAAWLKPYPDTKPSRFGLVKRVNLRSCDNRHTQLCFLGYRDSYQGTPFRRAEHGPRKSRLQPLLCPFRFVMPTLYELLPAPAPFSSLHRSAANETFFSPTDPPDYSCACCTTTAPRENSGCMNSWSCPIISILYSRSNAV